MNKDEAIAELERRVAESQQAETSEGELQRNTEAIGYPTPPRRNATYEEFAELMPLGRAAGDLPPYVDLHPAQSAALGAHGAISNTGFGLQQMLASIFAPKEVEAGVKKAAEANRRATQISREQNPKSTLAGEVAGGVASSLPFAGIGAGVAGGRAGAVLGDTLWGGSQYTTDDEFRVPNAVVAGGASLLMPPILAALQKGATGTLQRLFGRPRTAIAHDILEPSVMSPTKRGEVLDTATTRTEAAARLDPNLVLTPAEATGSPSIAQNQATAGKSPKGSMQMEEFWRNKDTGRVDKENKIVGDFFDEVTKKSTGSAATSSRSIRETAEEIAKKQMAKRKALADPLYKGSANDLVPTDISNQLLNDKNIAQAARELRKEVTFQEAAKGMKKNSIAVWDLIKQNIDDKIEKAMRTGEKNTARLLMKSKEKLTQTLDSISPTYQKARKIFTDESKVLDEILESDLGKIAKLKDSQLKNVSKILFDPAQVDPKVLAQIRTKLLSENPNVFYDSLAHHMRTQIDTQAATATKRKLPAFYKAVLNDDKKFNMYADALKGNPKAAQMLKDMKTAFQDLASDFTPKSSAALEKTSMTTSRNAFAHIWNLLSKGGAYDEAAVKFITDPHWLEKADRILKMKDGYAKTLAIGKMLERGGKEIAKKGGTRVMERDLPPRED